MIMIQMCEKYNRYLVSENRDILLCLYIGIQVKSNVPQQEQSEGLECNVRTQLVRYVPRATAGQLRTRVQDSSFKLYNLCSFIN